MVSREVIIERLSTLGYEYKPDQDAIALDFAIEKTRWHILNATNCSEVPEGLDYVAADMACSLFLKVKKGVGELTDIEFDSVAKGVSLGDTNVTFADGASPEQKFDATVEYLLSSHESDLLRYRKLVW